MAAEERIAALCELDGELIRLNLSPGGSADMLALAFLLDRWQTLSADLLIEEKEDLQ